MVETTAVIAVGRVLVTVHDNLGLYAPNYNTSITIYILIDVKNVLML